MKPFLRGHFHQASFFFTLGVSCMFLSMCQNERSTLAILIYSLGLTGLFGISALYHRPTWTPTWRMWMRRLDHACIFVMISATATPICLLALPEKLGNKLLLLTWTIAVFGTIQSLFWVKAPKWVSAILYISAGWIVIPYLPEFKSALGIGNLMLLLFGGLVYTLGAIIYALKRPNPFPRYFGYHEIFHLAVMLGAFLHFRVIYKMVN